MRRSTLHCALLSAVFISAIFTLSRLLNHDSARAAIVKTSTQTQGALQVVDKKGKPVGDCPLKHTTVKADVSGFISRVTVTQDFENPLPKKIEAVYTFPLPQAAAIDDLTMLIGERTIKGKIMRREEAETAYTAARELGQVAALLDQERPNIFLQQVANILPGQNIRITVSYVETLKYEDGSYEWSFPMVVGQRYIPAPKSPDHGLSRDAARISPPVVPEGMRAGHDISIELDLNSGVPILGVDSETHETEVELLDQTRARIQLKDRVTIPNKDFVLKYRVAGESINDAVLTHRTERGGFFTLILQPPQRVSPQDVMPKELVFVLDTSGSMAGFPIEKAKETAALALETLNPHDTFNLITFSGDTKILFPAPVPATEENLIEAKKMLSTHQGFGGTEMMKAITAALEPSESQHHLRIVCFMTDGQVGNDAEILAAVQKYQNARVFALGFGVNPNRYLLDKMSEYGRGDVDYVTFRGDTSAVARRFNERIRNPFLTDISIDWSGIPVTDVYPRLAPDLFAGKPLIFTGRYASGTKGTIRLHGKMGGEDYVREIPVELPEMTAENNVLATLWARRKVDDLMREEMTNFVPGSPTGEKREEITELGLQFKLMTQYTSFVAIDDLLFNGTDKPTRVDVPVEWTGFGAGATTGHQVMVTACNTSTTRMSESTAFLTVLAQSRSFERFMHIARGTVPVKTGGLVQPSAPTTLINGQPSNFAIDELSANFAIAPGGESPGVTASGNAPAFTASGGGNGIAQLDGIREMKIQTSVMNAEYGRTPNGQVSLESSGGTNSFHGSAFHFFGNDSFDASDWFANSHGLPQPPKNLNIFGGTFGGPIVRDKSFFFGAYEGMRLRQPMVGITEVPSLSARSNAPSTMSPFLNAFPVPNAPAGPDGFAEFSSSFANPAGHDVGSVRFDQNVTSALRLEGRYSFANSSAERRGADRLSLNTINRIRSSAQSMSGLMSYVVTPTMVVEVRGNYSSLRVDGSYFMDQFGGAAIPPILAPGSFAFDLNSRSAGWMVGDETRSVQRQFHLSGSVAKLINNHNLKFGADYRRLSPTIGIRSMQQSVLFDGVEQAVTGIAGRFSSLQHIGPQRPVIETYSVFAQEDWRITRDLTLNYGMRWDVAPAPSSEVVRAVDQVSIPATLNLAPLGSSLWRTTFGNFGPRAGLAYQLAGSSGYEVVLRSGFGVMYDVGYGRVGDVFANSLPFLSGSSAFNAPFSAGSASSAVLPFIAFDPHLKLPYNVNWNVSVETTLSSRNKITVDYLGTRGKRLLHTETVLDQNPDFGFLRATTNRGRSDYRALQATFQRHQSNGFESAVGYTWSRSVDNLTADSERSVVMTSLNPDDDLGPSDFHATHSVTGWLSYTLPALKSKGLTNKLSRNWTIGSIFSARSARPLNVAYMFPTSLGVGFLRPDVVSGVPVFISDPVAPGGRRINPNAFSAPTSLEQGSLSRNSLRGFPLYQVDLGLNRKFSFTESFALRIEAAAFNLFNRANFEDPLGSDLAIGSRFGDSHPLTPNLAFGESTSMSGRNLGSGGFASFYGTGGARTMRFAVKVLF